MAPPSLVPHQAAQEALRLAPQDFAARTALTIDVLLAEDAPSEVRLRYDNAVINVQSGTSQFADMVGLIDSVSLPPTAPDECTGPIVH
jgi:hypothetical protein